MKHRLAALMLAATLPTGAALPAGAMRPSDDARKDAKRFGLNRLERPLRRAPDQAAKNEFSRFNAASGGRWKLRFNPRTGAPAALSEGRASPRPAPPPRAGSPPGAGSTAVAVSRRFLEEQADLLGVDSSSLVVERQIEGAGHRHVLYRQTYRGLPVEFSRVKVHMGDDGSVIGFNSNYEPGLTLGATPSIDADVAARAAEADSRESGAGRGQSYGEAELVVLPVESTGRAHLAWKIKVRAPQASWRYYVDALTGKILFRYNNLRFATSGTITGQVYDLDPNGPLVTRPFANQWVYIGAAGDRALTAADGTYTSAVTGKVSMSLQGRYVNVANFRGPSAHHDNGLGVWLTASTPLSSSRPYPDNAVLTSTLTLPAAAPQFADAVKLLPVFTRFNVGCWFGGDAVNVGDICDDDEVMITDGSGAPVAKYVGNRGAFNGAAVPGKTLHLVLRSNAAGSTDGYDISVSSYLVLSSPGVPGVSNNHTWTPADSSSGLRGEMNLFYHLNMMHDYFAAGPNSAGAAPISGPVAAMMNVGPNLRNPFYSPEYDNLMFGDNNATTPNDLLTADATIPHHEYTHYLVEKIWSIQNFGQAGAISEGLADYFTASSLNNSSIGRYASGGVPLRELDCSKGTPSPPCPGAVLSPATWVGEIHDDSPFFSQALWDLRTALRAGTLGPANGQACADGLVFQGLLFFPESFLEFHDAMSRVADEARVVACTGLTPAAVKTAVVGAFSSHGLTLTGGRDAWEGDGFNDGFESAVDVSTLGSISATILPSGDQDFWSFGAGPGLVKLTLNLPVSGDYFKAYQLKLFDHAHRLVAAAAPPYNGINTIDGICNAADCTTTASSVALLYNNPTGGLFYLQVAGGDTIYSSASGVQSAAPYGLAFEFPRAGALGSSIVSASFDNDTIAFTVTVTSFVSTQDWRFSSVQLRDQAFTAIANTRVNVPPLPGDFVTFLSASNGLGRITGSMRLVPGFAARFPAVGTVHLEVFGYNVQGSTASLGLSNPLNLTASTAELTAFNNVFNPAKGEKATIKYAVTGAGRVVVKLYTVTGVHVATLLDADKPAGKGSLDWDGRNLSGAVVASGLYVVHVEGPGIRKTRKIAIIR